LTARGVTWQARASDGITALRRILAPRHAGGQKQWALLLAIVVLVLIFSILYPDTFATFDNLENVARQGSALLVVSIGQALVLLVGGFDISVGANMGFTSTVAALVMKDYGLAAGVLAGLACGTAVGFVNGVFISKVRINPFVMTLAMLTFLGGLANELSDGASVFGLPSGFSLFGKDDWGPIPSSVGMAAISLVLAWVLLTRTRVGLYLYAIGGSRETSTLAGVRVARYEILAYTLCGAMAGLAGLMLASRVQVGQAGIGQGFELLSIAAAVIGGVAIGGGTGRLSGVILGVALLSVISTGMNIAGWSQFVQQMITGGVLVTAAAVAVRRGTRFRLRDWFSLRTPGPPAAASSAAATGGGQAVREDVAAARNDSTGQERP
jgi:ribose/xylose/arabinose/galactoside ABC-type transport system permease subunit